MSSSGVLTKGKRISALIAICLISLLVVNHETSQVKFNVSQQLRVMGSFVEPLHSTTKQPSPKFSGLVLEPNESSLSEEDSPDWSFRSPKASNEPTLFFITPTHNCSSQIPDIVRLKQTLMLVSNCVWIVVEDAARPNPKVRKYLKGFPESNLIYVSAEKDKSMKILKGIRQRNKGLEVVEEMDKAKGNGTMSGVVYFGDDDNTYDAMFLERVRRETKSIALFNVGLIAFAAFEGPIAENGKIIGFQSGWNANRKFNIDMAGFAINLNLLRKHDYPKFRAAVGGYQETNYLEQFKMSANEMDYIHGLQAGEEPIKTTPVSSLVQ